MAYRRQRCPMRRSQLGFILVGKGRAMLGKPFNVADLFRNGEQGYWYDSSDLASMYQESTGITPAYAPGQGSADCPIGLRLDKRFGMTRGAEARAAGVISSIGTVTAATYNTATGDGSVVRVDGLNQSYVAFSGLTNTVTYEITVTNTGSTLLAVRSGVYSGSVVLTVAAGTTATCRATPTSGQFSVTYGSSAGTATFTGFSIKQLPGNHTSQSVAGSRPTLSARYNILLATAALSTQSVTTLAAPYKLSFTGTGTVTLSGTSTAGPLVGGGSLSFTPTAGTLTLTVTGSVTLADLRLADDAAKAIPAYQSVTTASTYDTAGFPWYLKADGFDDGMVTNTIDFTGTDKMTVWAGVTKLSDAAQADILELSSVYTNAGAFGLFGPDSAATRYSAAMTGTTSTFFQMTGFAAPNTSVLSVLFDISGASRATEIFPRVNGAIPTLVGGGTAADAGTGNFGNYPMYLYRRNGASIPFNGRDYGQIVRGAISTAAQIANAERYLARNMGLSF